MAQVHVVVAPSCDWRVVGVYASPIAASSAREDYGDDAQVFSLPVVEEPAVRPPNAVTLVVDSFATLLHEQVPKALGVLSQGLEAAQAVATARQRIINVQVWLVQQGTWPLKAQIFLAPVVSDWVGPGTPTGGPL